MNRFSKLAVQRRIAALFVAVSVLTLLLLLRLAYLQLWHGDRFLDMALAQRFSPVPLLPDRGTIYDRNMVPLATSISAEAVYAVPVEVEDPVRTAHELAPLLDVDADWLLSRLEQNVRTVWLRLKVDPETARAVRARALPGIYITERPQRFYPHGKLAANVLGFAGIDNQGLEGLEAYYENVLKGTEGMLVRERDATGRPIPDGLERRIEPTDGLDIVLTVDHVIQYIVERELERGVLESQAEMGIFVAVDPKTGDILAMATYPSFDPNHFSDYPPELWKNRAVTDQFEPGSTFKVITGSVALEVGAATLASTYVDPVRLERWGGVVNCWRAGGHGEQTFVEALENSCNPVFAVMSADEIGPARFYEYIRAFGFGGRLGIDFPGEGTGLVPRPTPNPSLQWANVGFGQGIAVTPLQMAMAVAAIANGGTLYKPRLVKEIRTKDGDIVEARAPEIIRQVLSRQTAQEFISAMRSVVANGSGTRADVPGYRVAGKTGTAQIPEHGRYIDLNMATFVGFAPADDPAIVGVVMLYKVHAQPSWGGTWAAPVFGRVVEEALEYMGIPRRYETPEPVPKEKVVIPNIRNLPAEEAEERLAAAGLKVAHEGYGSYALDVIPVPGTVVDKGTTVLLVFHEEELPEPTIVTVPDVTGLSMRDAAFALQEKGLRIRIQGTGVATSQFPAPGERTPSGSVVEVQFSSPGTSAP